MGFSRLAAAIALVALAACQREAKLTVSQVGGSVVITASRDDGPACVSGLYVYKDAPAGRSDWHLSSLPEASCTSRFTLGQVPPGFAANTSAPTIAIEPGRSYTVEVTGSGFIGATKFVADAARP